MQELVGNLWDQDGVLCITTNGDVRKDGALVMGRGVALQAAQRWPRLPFDIGAYIKRHGNVLHGRGLLDGDDYREIVCFPVKHHWREKADLTLIAESCRVLMLLADTYHWDRIILPRPGCGNGQLDWETEVKPVIAPLLDDRVFVITDSLT